MASRRKSYDAEFKVQVVLESMQRDTTIEEVRTRYGIGANLVNRWRQKFKENAYKAFVRESRNKGKKADRKENPEYLKKIIADLTIENDILKKALSVWD